MMKWEIVVWAIMVFVILAFSPNAQARPYFKVKPLSKIEAGAFFKLGTPQDGNVKLGLMSPFVWHDKEDGYWLVPGVDWSLLNVGVTTDPDFLKGSLLLGPGVRLDEPIKAILRRGLNYLPGNGNDGSYGLLRNILAPGNDSTYLSVGPMWGLSPNGQWNISKWRGSLQVGATLAQRWGGK